MEPRKVIYSEGQLGIVPGALFHSPRHDLAKAAIAASRVGS
jgi:hypothetical protein